MNLNHFVLNIEKQYQVDSQTIESIRVAGFPYQPKWGKGTKGFKASNLWIGKEYFEMIHLLKKDGGGWKQDWVERYNEGHRGLVCIMLDVKDIDSLYVQLKEIGVNITPPVQLEFKWFFNLLTRGMPWKNAYFDFFEGVPLQIGLQQMDNEEAYKFMAQYMIPNATENEIDGITEVQVRGSFTENDFRLIENIFNVNRESEECITVCLENNQRIIFKKSHDYTVEFKTHCNHALYNRKKIQIENCNITNG